MGGCRIRSLNVAVSQLPRMSKLVVDRYAPSPTLSPTDPVPRGLLTLCLWASSGPQGLYTAYIQPIYSLYTAYMQICSLYAARREKERGGVQVFLPDMRVTCHLQHDARQRGAARQLPGPSARALSRQMVCH